MKSRATFGTTAALLSLLSGIAMACQGGTDRRSGAPEQEWSTELVESNTEEEQETEDAADGGSYMKRKDDTEWAADNGDRQDSGGLESVGRTFEEHGCESVQDDEPCLVEMCNNRRAWNRLKKSCDAGEHDAGVCEGFRICYINKFFPCFEEVCPDGMPSEEYTEEKASELQSCASYAQICAAWAAAPPD